MVQKIIIICKLYYVAKKIKIFIVSFLFVIPYILAVKADAFAEFMTYGNKINANLMNDGIVWKVLDEILNLREVS